MNAKQLPIICIIGPTAIGKTKVAVALARQLNAEIISVDARQVYQQLNIGTGKDLASYFIDGIKIPYHLIDIIAVNERYHIYQFQQDFFNAVADIQSRGKRVIICGGTGLYLESVIMLFEYTAVPINESLRAGLLNLDLPNLQRIFEQIPAISLSNFQPDLTTQKRSIRAIEIKTYLQNNKVPSTNFPKLIYQVFALNGPVAIRNKNIDQRLQDRLDEGLLDEVNQLLANGVLPEQLNYFGLEYKFCLAYLQGKYDLPSLQTKLSVAIHQYAKRQLTYFRKMEKAGIAITWLDAQDQPEAYVLAAMEAKK
jgi:tRNA dimethylallyltransferase